MTTPSPAPTLPDGTYLLDPEVPSAERVIVGIVGGRVVQATHRYAGGQVVRLLLQPDKTVTHDPVDLDVSGLTVLRTRPEPQYVVNAHDIEQGLEHGRLSDKPLGVMDYGPSRTTTVPERVVTRADEGFALRRVEDVALPVEAPGQVTVPAAPVAPVVLERTTTPEPPAVPVVGAGRRRGTGSPAPLVPDDL